METKTEKAFALVLIELEKAKAKHSHFPGGASGLAIISEEYLELVREINDMMSCADSFEVIRQRILEEASHVAVTAIRMIEHYIERDEENNYDGK